MLRLTTALCLLSPAVASAQCLTAEALDSGITIEYGSGSVSYLTRNADGTQVDSYLDDRGYKSYGQTNIFQSVYGAFPLQDTTHYADSWEGLTSSKISYNFELPAADALVPGARGAGQATVESDIFDPRTEEFGWSVYESAPLVVGDCSYRAVKVFTTIFSPFTGMAFRSVIYLPELGIGLQTANTKMRYPVTNADITGLSITAP